MLHRYMLLRKFIVATNVGKVLWYSVLHIVGHENKTQWASTIIFFNEVK